MWAYFEPETSSGEHTRWGWGYFCIVLCLGSLQGDSVCVCVFWHEWREGFDCLFVASSVKPWRPCELLWCAAAAVGVCASYRALLGKSWLRSLMSLSASNLGTDRILAAAWKLRSEDTRNCLPYGSLLSLIILTRTSLQYPRLHYHYTYDKPYELLTARVWWQCNHGKHFDAYIVYVCIIINEKELTAHISWKLSLDRVDFLILNNYYYSDK